MEIMGLFPHPISRLDLGDEIDNETIVKSVDDLSENISEEEASKYWDCKLITSYNNDAINIEFAKQNKFFIETVEKYVNEFMMHVGWYEPGNPNKVTSMWFNKYIEGHHFQEAHNHGGHEVCAIYYATSDLTPTLFLNPNHQSYHCNYEPTDITPFTDKCYNSMAQPGTLVIFPGYLQHSVPYIRKNESNYDLIKNRITIAMNFGKYRKSLLTKTEE